jgi:chitosanase
MINPTQKQTAEAIVNIFETGSVLGDYGHVTLLPGDLGQLSYGRSQVTLTSGTLSSLVHEYCAVGTARFSTQLTPFLTKLANASASLNTNRYFHNLLRASADDPAMRRVQDRFFDDHYWRRAVNSASRMGISSPLGVAVVYDSRIHGSWGRIRRRTNQAVGLISSIGEKKWIQAYVNQRREWLANHRILILRKTVYRMNTFSALIAMGFWSLELPMVVRSLEISESSLKAQPRNTYKGPQVRSRDIIVKSPLMRGLDVRLVQLALSANKIKVGADGIFGSNSAKAVREFQKKSGLPETGTIGTTDFTQLGL